MLLPVWDLSCPWSVPDLTNYLLMFHLILLFIRILVRLWEEYWSMVRKPITTNLFHLHDSQVTYSFIQFNLLMFQYLSGYRWLDFASLKNKHNCLASFLSSSVFLIARIQIMFIFVCWGIVIQTCYMKEMFHLCHVYSRSSQWPIFEKYSKKTNNNGLTQTCVLLLLIINILHVQIAVLHLPASWPDSFLVWPYLTVWH